MIKLLTKRKIQKSKSRPKLAHNHKVKSAVGRSPGHRRDCNACNEIYLRNQNKAQPVSFTHDYERLQYFVRLYSQFVQTGKVTPASQCITKIKANHPILFRLKQSAVNYLVKNSKILFKLKGEELYCERERVDKAVYILLYGRCKLKKE